MSEIESAEAFWDRLALRGYTSHKQIHNLIRERDTAVRADERRKVLEEAMKLLDEHEAEAVLGIWNEGQGDMREYGPASGLLRRMIGEGAGDN